MRSSRMCYQLIWHNHNAMTIRYYLFLRLNKKFRMKAAFSATELYCVHKQILPLCYLFLPISTCDLGRSLAAWLRIMEQKYRLYCSVTFYLIVASATTSTNSRLLNTWRLDLNDSYSQVRFWIFFVTNLTLYIATLRLHYGQLAYWSNCSTLPPSA